MGSFTTIQFAGLTDWGCLWRPVPERLKPLLQAQACVGFGETARKPPPTKVPTLWLRYR